MALRHHGVGRSAAHVAARVRAPRRSGRHRARGEVGRRSGGRRGEARHRRSGAHAPAGVGEGAARGVRRRGCAQPALDDELMALATRYRGTLAAACARRSTCASSSIPSSRAAARGTSCFRARPPTSRARHGTFDDVIEARLPYVAEHGLRRSVPAADPSDRPRAAQGPQQRAHGQPRRCRAAHGRSARRRAVTRRSIRELGTLDDFRRLVARRPRRTASQSRSTSRFRRAPDHPYVKAHPEWFRWRPDGTVQYAENPPKKYQDIYPLNFESEDWPALWEELRRRLHVLDRPGRAHFPRRQSAHQAVRVLGVGDRRGEARASRRASFWPRRSRGRKIMHRLAKARLLAVVHVLHVAQHQAGAHRVFHRARARARARILPPQLLAEHAGYPARIVCSSAAAPAFTLRLVLAATLAANYGIYGPAFELMEHAPRDAGSEEYLNSEKYELRHWDLDAGRQPRRRSSRASTASAATIPRCSRTGRCSFTASITIS